MNNQDDNRMKQDDLLVDASTAGDSQGETGSLARPRHLLDLSGRILLDIPSV
jgi:hypothetical protein